MTTSDYFSLFGAWAFGAFILLNGVCVLKSLSLPNQRPKNLLIIYIYGASQLACAFFIFTAGLKKFSDQTDILSLWWFLGIIAPIISLFVRPNTMSGVAGGRPSSGSGAPIILLETDSWEGSYQKLLMLVFFVAIQKNSSLRVLMLLLFFIIIFITKYEKNKKDIHLE